MEDVVAGLQRLTQLPNVIVKVLITSPNIAVEVEQPLDEKDILHVLREMVNGRRQGFGAGQFEDDVQVAS